MKLARTIYSIAAFLFLFALYLSLTGFDDGIVGFTKKNGNTVGCVCHDLNPNTRVSVVLSGPSTVVINDSATFTLRISGGPAVAGGCDISTSLGNVYLSYLDTNLRRDEPFPGAGFELTHRDPVLSVGGVIEFTFKYVAPSTPNVIDTIFANGNSVNHDTTNENDQWNYAADFLINIIDNPLPVELASFTSEVRGANVTLNWVTSSENNNRGFAIERRRDNGIWNRIGFVNGKGNSSIPSEYLYTDRNVSPGIYNYRLNQADYNENNQYYLLDGEVSVAAPEKFSLEQNYPNPFNPTTTITFEIPMDNFVELKIYDVAGKEIITLMNEYKTTGKYDINFNGINLPSGAYFYKLKSGDFTSVRKMTLIK